ncbi:MAG: hypothetical protein AAF799_05985 [Myxococcota bacterium]
MAARVWISTAFVTTAAALALAMGCGSSSDKGGDKDEKAEGGAKGEKAGPKTPDQIAAAYPVGSTAGCDAKALEAATGTLKDVPADGLAKAAGAAITAACGEALSDEQKRFLRLVEQNLRPFTDGVEKETDAIAAEACPSLAKLRADNAKVAPLDAAQAIFDGCGFAEYGVLSKDDVTAYYGADPWANSFFPWLAERGVAGPVAASVVRGLLTFQTHTAGAASMGSEGRLPTVAKAGAIPVCPIVRVSTRSIDLDWKKLVMIGPEKEIDPSALRGHLVGPLYKELEPLRPADGDETPLCIAADATMPFSTVVDLMYTGARLNFRHFAWVVATEDKPHGFGAVPADPPSFARPGQEAPFGPGLRLSTSAISMELASEGYEKKYEAIGTGLDYDALAKKLGRMKLEVPDASIVTIRADGEVPVSVLAKTLAVGAEAGFQPVVEAGP